jgi:hypothetical protein
MGIFYGGVTRELREAMQNLNFKANIIKVE